MSTFQINNRITVLLANLPGLPLPSLPFADFTDPTKKWLPNLPLPNLPVAQFSVAQFSVAHFTVAQFTVYLFEYS